jgi:hypothetical protein
MFVGDRREAVTRKPDVFVLIFSSHHVSPVQ